MNWGLKMPRDAKRKMILPFMPSFQMIFPTFGTSFLPYPVLVIVVLTSYIIHKNKSSNISLKDSKF